MKKEGARKEEVDKIVSDPVSYIVLAADTCHRISGRLSGIAWTFGREAEKTTGIEKKKLEELEAKADRLAFYFHHEATLAQERNLKAIIRAVTCHTIFEREKLDNKNYILNRPLHYVDHNSGQERSSCTNE